MQLISKTFFAFLLCIITVGCANLPSHSSSSCEGVDFYEFGRQSGAKGLPVGSATPGNMTSCLPSRESAEYQRYVNGHNAGLVDYCSAENGYILGKAGQIYSDVCPVISERHFLKAYDLGKNARALELENQKLDTQMSKIFLMLERQPASSDTNHQRLRIQLSQLQASRQKNESRLRGIEQSFN